MSADRDADGFRWKTNFFFGAPPPNPEAGGAPAKSLDTKLERPTVSWVWAERFNLYSTLQMMLPRETKTYATQPGVRVLFGTAGAPLCSSFVIRDHVETRVKVKVKVLPITDHEGPEGGWRYSPTLS